jgi:hypothetical protein
MAQKSGFFNALLQAGVYDRQYNADDYCDNLAVIISDGVLRDENNGLKVIASGLNLSVNAGRAWIKGHYYHNDTAYSLPAVVPPTGGSRIDRVILRFNKSISVRSISLQYLQGTAGTSPVAPALTRTSEIYDICLAEISVSAGDSSAAVTDTRGDKNLCGWVYSVSGDNSFFENFDEEFEEWFTEVRDTLASVTLFKQYKWEDTLETATNTVQFNIPQYDPEVCFFDVFVNGVLSLDYTASGQDGNILTFGTTLVAGTEVTVCAYKSIDGTGIMTVADEITELQNQFATLDGVSKFTYNCTGLNDNIALSQISEAFYEQDMGVARNASARAFLRALGGNSYLRNLPLDAKITIEVVGTLGATTPVAGSGTSGSKYRYFALGQTSRMTKHLIFDFAKCDKIEVECAANTENIIFYGSDLDLRNLSCKATGSGTDCAIQMIGKGTAGRVNCEDCSFEVICNMKAVIATHGTFLNCYGWTASAASDSMVFVPDTTSLIRVIGGTYIAHAFAGYRTAAVFYTYAASANAVVMAQNINCPIKSYSSHWQQYVSVAYGGHTVINGLTSTLPSTGNNNSITNQIEVSKDW